MHRLLRAVSLGGCVEDMEGVDTYLDFGALGQGR
jgi:hypothetical protein